MLYLCKLFDPGVLEEYHTFLCQDIEQLLLDILLQGIFLRYNYLMLHMVPLHHNLLTLLLFPYTLFLGISKGKLFSLELPHPIILAQKFLLYLYLLP